MLEKEMGKSEPAHTEQESKLQGKLTIKSFSFFFIILIFGHLFRHLSRGWPDSTSTAMLACLHPPQNLARSTNQSNHWTLQPWARDP